jgi:YjbE family integral membrane protein
MNHLFILIFGILQITLLDLALCADNIGVIALATRKLSDKHARTASIIGISGAIFLRIYFAYIISFIFKVSWFPIRLIGGIILVKVTWDLIKPHLETDTKQVKSSEQFWNAVISIILADISMSLDNVIAITSAAGGDVTLIAFGILLNIPLIFFGSRFVVNIMRKYPMVIYIGASILAFTSVKMIIEEKLLKSYILISDKGAIITPLLAASLTIAYGFYTVYIKGIDDNNKPMFRKAS